MNSRPNIKPDDRLALVEKAIEEHGSYLRAYLHGLTKNYHDAEELFDDLWLFVFERFQEQDIAKLGYLRRKAYQLFVDHWRKQQRRLEIAVAETPEVAIPALRQDSLSLAGQEDGVFKESFFSEYPEVDLTPDHRTALWLSARHGYTHTEISKIMDIPSSTVGDWIKQAKKAFADNYNNH